MTTIQNILVGVDPVQADGCGTPNVKEAAGAIRQAINIAQKAAARLTFMSVVDIAGRLLKHAHADAQQALARQIGEIGDPQAMGDIDVEVIDGRCDPAVLESIQAHKINLLVMGTSARSGLAQILLGNTVERLLPYTNCSLLVVKPDGFQCPLHLDLETDT